MEENSWIDIGDVAKKLQQRAESILKEWFPNGKKLGNEFLVGSLNGEAGQSLRINLETGMWMDFASPADKGGDLVSLFAALNGITNPEAARRLAEDFGLRTKTERKSNGNGHASNVVGIYDPFHDPQWGQPTEKYTYYKDSKPYFWVCRYERNTDDGKRLKSFKQLTLRPDGVWVVGLKAAGIKAPYPLFSDKIETDTVLIVEGEKTCVAARKISPHDVVTWFGGTKNVGRADWSPVYGKKIIIWPDNDGPGHEAAQKLKSILKEHCEYIRLVDTSKFEQKWDAFDFVQAKRLWNEISYKKYESLELSLNSRGEPHANESNVRIVLQQGKYQDIFWFDEFRKRKMCGERRMEDPDFLRALIYFQGELNMHTVAKTTVQTAVLYECDRNRKNPVKDYFNSLDIKWDGTPRIKDYMNRVYGCVRTSYSMEVSKNFFLSMVARILNPGCKFDHMIILEGKQGIKKSMSLKELATEEFYWDCSEPMGTKDFVRGLKGKILVEISELNSILKADTEMVKKTLSCSVDEYVEKYETQSLVLPRTCIFVGTTNEAEYLKDATGNRRFWPLKVEKEADTEYIKANREQLFAEAVYRFKQGETYWDFKEEESKKEVIQHQEDRLIVDEWADKISEILSQNVETTIPYVLETLGIPTERQGAREKHRVGRCLKMLGYENRVKRGENGKTKRIWIKE